jgi:DNA polymerase-3 subunit alpha
MTERLESTIPFVGLHAHSVGGSPFDALGYITEHMESAYDNGLDAFAITDHGNMNSLAEMVLTAKKMHKSGKEFKPIYGVEAYFHPSIEQWKEDMEEAKKNKKNAASLRDNNTSGAVVETEVRTYKSIVNRRSHLVLLAQNQKGLENIFQMVSKSFQGDYFYRFPRIDYALLEKHSEGVIVSTACLGGLFAGDMWRNKEQGSEAILDAMRETASKMTSIFGDRFFAELQWNNIPEQHDLNKYVIQIAKEFNITLVSTADSHYPTPDTWKDRILYKKLGWLGKGKEMDSELPVDVEEVGYELYPKNGDQMWESYKKYSEDAGVEYDDDLVLESIKSTHTIAHEMIETFFPNDEVRLPDFVVPPGKTATQALVAASIEGLRDFKLAKKQDYVDRLKRELEVISERGFSKYFLTMKAIADRAVQEQLTGPGRGSAAGSLVAYVLGITQVDPIKYGLLFSRFLRADATDYPDIDYDVASPMLLKEKLVEEWGENTVVPITNWNTLQLRSLIKDISKFYKIPFNEVNNVTGRMLAEATPKAKAKHGLSAGVYTPTFEEVMEFSETLQKFLQQYPHVKTHVEALYGQVRSSSRHAGGVVIADDLHKHMPLIASGGVRQTPWSEGQNVRHLEPMGFIKFDILGLASLRMMEDAIRSILTRHHGVRKPTFADVKKYYAEKLHPDVINFDDQEVYENVFHKGKWAGVFQFTETGAQNFCVNAQPRSIIDISAITSIFRPGPLSAKVDRNYVAAKSNPDDVNYANETIREITEETYGFLIFQEQIALLAHKLGKDISLDEGNLLRKLLTKKGTGKGAEDKMKIFHKFIDGCVEKEMTRNEAEKLWETFEFFSGYGFNKSHAVSYSILSYQCAWLLNYYPVEWVAAFLDKEPESRKERAINTAKKMGFEIRPLDINLSTKNWTIGDDGALIQPFSSVKGLGDAAIDQILNFRPFETIEDFLFHDRIVYSKLNKKALDVLVRSEALNSIMDDRFTGLRHFWSAVAVDRAKTKKKFNENIEKYAPEGHFTDQETIEYQVSLTGMFPIHLVMSDEVMKQLDDNMIPPLGDFMPEVPVAWFIPREIVPRKTKNGKAYWIVKVIDSTSTPNAIKCWGVRDNDHVELNKPYMAKLDFHDQWGFSTRSLRHNFKLLA